FRFGIYSGTRRRNFKESGPVAMFRIVKTASEWSLRASSSDARKKSFLWTSAMQIDNFHLS
ncbi:unnamed protein product, partial [Oikopleura dioica]